jgi:hypothetical protein
LKLQRPLQEKELQILDKQLKQLEKNYKRQTRFLLIWSLLCIAVGSFAFFSMERIDEVLLLFASVAACIGIAVWVTGKEYVQQRRKRKSIVFLKNKNLVTVVEVRSDKYYELKEQEDEGVHYLFQLDDNKVFSFGGQDFYRSRRFPSNSFEIVEGRGINNEIVMLETFSYGKSIKPARVIAGQEKWDLLNRADYPDPYELTIVEGRIEDYVETATSPET